MESVEELLVKLKELLEGGMERLGGEEMLFVVSELQSIINQIKVDIEAAVCTTMEVQKFFFEGSNSIQSGDESEGEEKNLFFYLDEKNQALSVEQYSDPSNNSQGQQNQGLVENISGSLPAGQTQEESQAEDGPGHSKEVQELQEDEREGRNDEAEGQEHARESQEDGFPEEDSRVNNENLLVLNSKDAQFPYECSVCWKSYKTLSGARHHTAARHSATPLTARLRCGEEGCTYSTWSRNLFRIHLASHADNAPLTCPVCKKEYLGGPKALRQHMKLHDSKREYKCEVCFKDFINLSRLNHHIQNVHSEPSFHCDQCSKMFRSKANFNRHVRIHTNEKPFVCPFCLFTCNNSGNLSSHVRSVHKDKDFTTGREEKTRKRARLVKNIMEKKASSSILSLLGTSQPDHTTLSRSLGENLLKKMEEHGEIQPVQSIQTILKPSLDIQSGQSSALKSSKSCSFLKSSNRDQTITVRNSQGVLVSAVVKLKKGNQNGDQVLHVCVKE